LGKGVAKSSELSKEEIIKVKVKTALYLPVIRYFRASEGSGKRLPNPPLGKLWQASPAGYFRLRLANAEKTFFTGEKTSLLASEANKFIE